MAELLTNVQKELQLLTVTKKQLKDHVMTKHTLSVWGNLLEVTKNKYLVSSWPIMMQNNKGNQKPSHKKETASKASCLLICLEWMHAWKTLSLYMQIHSGCASVFYLGGCCLLIKSFVKARGPLWEDEYNTAHLSLCVFLCVNIRSFYSLLTFDLTVNDFPFFPLVCYSVSLLAAVRVYELY